MNEIDDLIIELLEIRSDIEADFTVKEKELIHKISEMCEDLEIVQDTKEQGESYAGEMTAKQVYFDMLCKIVQAPTNIHMRMAVRLLIPIIDRKIREEGHEEKDEEEL